MVRTSPLHTLGSSLALVAAAVRIGLEQPSSAARVGDVGADRLPALRRCDGRGVLRRSRSRRGSAAPPFTVSFRWANASPLNGSSRN
jgi:hypothetical protein